MNTENKGTGPKVRLPFMETPGELPQALPTVVAFLEWPEDPPVLELMEALARILAKSSRDIWGVEELQPLCVPKKVEDWLRRAPEWPAFRPAREAWLAASVFLLERDAAGWIQDGRRLNDDWVRASVAHFLKMAGLLDDPKKKPLTLVNATMAELKRLPWPEDRLAPSEDPLAGWIRGALVLAPKNYVSTAEIFAVWRHDVPQEAGNLQEFGRRLAAAIQAWRKSDLGSGAIAPVANIRRSCCKKYPHANRPRGWGGLALNKDALLRWQAVEGEQAVSPILKEEVQPSTGG